jgi:hypothetical protein
MDRRLFPGGEGVPGKRLELLKEVAPGFSRVAILTNPSNQGHAPGLDELRVAADALKLKLQVLRSRTAEELDSSFAAAVRGRADGILEIPDPMFSQERRRITHLAAESRIPALYSSKEWATAGGLISRRGDLASATAPARNRVSFSVTRRSSARRASVTCSTAWRADIEGRRRPRGGDLVAEPLDLFAAPPK